LGVVGKALSISIYQILEGSSAGKWASCDRAFPSLQTLWINASIGVTRNTSAIPIVRTILPGLVSICVICTTRTGLTTTTEYAEPQFTKCTPSLALLTREVLVPNSGTGLATIIVNSRKAAVDFIVDSIL
jgi:hypothetical protein